MTLVSGYDHSTPGVGGRIEALWLGKKPNYLPEEFYWLVGATGGYLPAKPMRTRNLWSCNASYKRSVLDELGGFSETFGGDLGRLLFQGECAEFGLRISKIKGYAPRYVPTAVVYHKIRGDRLRLGWLFGRACRQGYAKAYIQRLHGSRYALSVEYGFLDSLVKSNLRRLGHVIHGPEKRYALEQFAFSLSSTAAVLIGFVLGLATIRVSHQDRVKIANRTTNTPPDHTHEASPRS